MTIVGINIVRHLPEEDWRNFIDKHPSGNIFHTPEMFQVFSRTKGHKPELWAAVKNDRISALLLPVKISLMNGFLQYFTTRSVVYGSVISEANSEGQEALASLLQAYTHEIGRSTLFTELRNLSSLETIQPILRENGFDYESHLNYLIDLKRSPESIFLTIGRRTRKNIRRMLRRGKVEIKEIKRREQVTSCYKLLRHTYRAAHVPLADLSLFENAFDLLYPKGMVRFTQARVGTILVAISVELVYKKVIFGWYSGMDRAYGSYVPNELLMWHILQWGAENGYCLYDFGGAGKPDEEYGVRDFKAKFGGKLVSYGRNICVHSPRLLWLSERGYNLLRRWL